VIAVAQAFRPAVRAALKGCATALLFATQLQAATLFDPALRFRTITTEHFVIYFHQHESATASRLAAIAEETWRAIQGPLAITPPGRTHVVLADQVDYTNGYATPLPYNTIVIYAAWPAGSEFVGNIDDWLRVAFMHEFTHIVHLDRSEGWARWVHGIFGRTGLAFPNLFLPTWQIEGLATYEESALTGLGRIDAGDFTAIVHEASRHGAVEPLDRVNGGLTAWPSGFAPYAYGAGFHDYLAERFGAEALGDLANATARALPYTGSRAFKQVFGEPLGDLWREYASTLPTDTSVVEGERITRHGFTVAGPRFDRASPREVWYSVSNADDFPALYRVNLDTHDTTRVVRRYLGSTSGVGHRVVYFDQQEWRRNTGLYSDLYALDRATQHVTALTREARVLDPDLSPDESTIVAVRDRADRRDLVLVPVRGAAQIRESDITVLASEAEMQFNAPRWSPDGRQIAVERHRIGALSDVVVVDIATHDVRAIASLADARVVTPAWRPDGRAIIAAVAREKEPFNLVEFSIDGTSEARQLTHTTGGATWPDVAPDGSTIVFVGYTDAGFDLFETAYRPVTSQLVTSRLVVPATSRLATTSGLETSGLVTVPTSRDYSPWRTLTPTSWFPLIATDSAQLRAGAIVNGIDVLGYHSYSASATWLVSGPADAMRPPSAAPDWQLTYVYDRWRPSLFAAASSTTSFFAGPPTDAGTPVDATRREREFEAGVIVPIRHTRTTQTFAVSALRAVDEYALGNDTLDRNRSAIRTAWAGNTAQAYGYSISPEGGVTAGMTAEFVRRALGSFEDATIVTADARAYLPGLASHQVVALRAAAGVSNGDPTVGRTFLLGGSDTDLGVASFSSRAISLLRGFPSNAFAGSRVAVVNADYRFPLARPQRGAGTWPIFLHTLHAAVFADAGDAWSGTFRSGTIKTSLGAELSTSIVAGYVFPFTIAIGTAWGHDPSGVATSGATTYVRVGKAF
jgi:hypothetical protein